MALPHHPTTAAGLSNLAGVLVSICNYEEAKPLYVHALAIQEQQLGPGHPDTARGLNNLAALLLDLREWSEAWDLVKRNQGESRGHLARILSARTREEGRRYLSTLLWQEELSLSFPTFFRTSEVELGAAQGLLSWKGQVGRAERAVRQLSRESEETREVSDRLRLLHGELSRLAFDDEMSTEPRSRRLDVVRGRITELELKLRKALNPDALDELGVNALRERLPEHAALVSFFVHHIRQPARYKDDEIVEQGSWSEPHLVAWVIRAGADVVSVDLGLADVLKARTNDFLVALAESRESGPDATDDKAGPNRTLRELIWDPLIPPLGDASLVIVSHDQFTATLPFEVLKDENGHYLVEERSFAYLHDLQSIGGFEEEPKREFGSLFCVGGVEFDDRDEPATLETVAMRGELDAPKERWQSWARLDNTQTEALAIRDLHEELMPKGSRLLVTGIDATEERVLAEMPYASIVHLATHGYFQPEGLPSMWAAAKEETERQRELGGMQSQSGLLESDRKLTGYMPEVLSGLVFAGANLEREEGRLDGYLTAADVDWMDLSGVELVTLSACETGLGRNESGEGMSGFRTTLLRAGAKTVVSSLWRVPDDSTERLMSRFYENLLRNNMGKLEALREAQLWMLKKNRRENHGDGLPQTWGAFVLSGDWR